MASSLPASVRAGRRAAASAPSPDSEAGRRPQPEDTPVPEDRRRRRRRERHQGILETAAALFARDGYDATTVEKIATAADIAPATFFNHFPSKEDALREIGQDVFSRFRRLIDEQLARDVASIERLHGFAERSAALARRAPDMTRRVLVAVLRTSRPGEAGAELAAMHADFTRLLEAGRDIPDDLDVDLTAEILVSVVIGAMTHWINDAHYPLEARMRQSLSLLGQRLIAPADAARTRPARRPRRNEPADTKPTRTTP